MLLEVKIRRSSGAVFGGLFAIAALLACAFVFTSAEAQTGEPVKIGYSMALTGGLAPNGKSALLAQKLRHKLDRVGNADRHRAKEGIHRPVRDRGE
jgi:hypothetical protein